MENKVIFENDLVSLVWGCNGTRLDMLDSDGEFIDYFFYVEDLDENDNVEEKVNWVINKIKNMPDWELADFIYETFDMHDVVYDCDLINFFALKEEYGEENVIRVGNTVVIVEE